MEAPILYLFNRASDGQWIFGKNTDCEVAAGQFRLVPSADRTTVDVYQYKLKRSLYYRVPVTNFKDENGNSYATFNDLKAAYLGFSQQGTLLNLAPEYKAVYNAMTSKPSSKVTKSQNTFVKTLVDGGVWSKLDILDILGVHVNSASEALKNWKNPTVNNPSVVNAPTFTKYKGFKGVAATTSYLNLNYSPRTQAVNFGVNSNHLGIFSPSLHPNSKRFVGVESNGNFLLFSSSQTAMLVRNANSTGDTVSGLTLHGCLISNRSTSANTQFYHNGVKKQDGTTAAQALLPNANLFALAENSSGTPNAITDGYLFAVFAGASLTEAEILIISNALTALYDSYFVKLKIATIPDVIGGNNQANTGITVNTTLKEIYVVSAVEGKVYVFNYDLTYKRTIIPPTGAYVSQGLEWDSVRNVFYSWQNGTPPRLYVWTESALVRAYDFNYGVPGSLSYNPTDDCLYSLSVAGLVIKKHIYNAETNLWTFDSDIAVSLADEGIAYDVDTDTIWHNQNNGFIANIQKNGTLIDTYKQPKGWNGENEGLVYNSDTKTFFANTDTFFHGGVVGGNYTWELDLKVYS